MKRFFPKVSLNETFIVNTWLEIERPLDQKQTIEEFVVKNSHARIGFSHWLGIIGHADWDKPEDILSSFGSADILGKGTKRVVFNIQGNHYRMICKYHFGAKMIHLFIMWIGSHAAYDNLCASGSQYTISKY